LRTALHAASLDRGGRTSLHALLARVDAARTRPFRILVLCCGTGSVEKTVHKHFAGVDVRERSEEFLQNQTYQLYVRVVWVCGARNRAGGVGAE